MEAAAALAHAPSGSLASHAVLQESVAASCLSDLGSPRFFPQSVRQVGREGLVFTRGVCVCRPPTRFLRTVPLTLSFSPSDPAGPAFLFFPCFMLLGSSGRPTPPLAPAVHLLQSFFLL